MAKRVFNGECLVYCKHCGTANTATWKKNLFGTSGKWVLHNCVKCNTKFDAKTIETVVCPHCQKLVEQTEDNKCLACGKTMYKENECVKAECSNCGTMNVIPLAEKDGWECVICGEKFGPITNVKPVNPAEPMYIKLKNQQQMMTEDLVIWKHPMNQFPCYSRLQVSEGTWALLLQDGVCQYPLGPGSYMLEDTKLTREEKMEAGNDEESGYNTDIFCVLKTLPAIDWGAYVPNVQNAAKTRDYKVGTNGRIAWNVVDAKAFAEKFGFRDWKGKAELLKQTDKPDENDSELVEETRRNMIQALRKWAEKSINADKIEPDQLRYHQAEMEAFLKQELDRQMDVFGLGVASLKSDEIHVDEIADSAVTTETKRKEAIRKGAEAEIIWNLNDVRVHVQGQPKLAADYTFAGSFRCAIADEEKFFGVSEVEALPDNAADAEAYVRKLAGRALYTYLPQLAQDLIDQQDVPVRELSRRKEELAASLKRKVGELLAGQGLALDSLVIISADYTESAELKKAETREERKKIVVRYAEEQIRWEADSVSVHQKDQPIMKADVVFSGELRLRVKDKERFFAASEVDGFLDKEPQVTAAEVSDYYRNKIRGLLYSELAGIAQNLIDLRDIDIPDLDRYNQDLENRIKARLDELTAQWGFGVESIHLAKTRIQESFELQQKRNVASHAVKTNLDEQKKSIDDRHEVFVASSDAEKDKKIDDIATDAYGHGVDNKIQRSEFDEKQKDTDTDHEINDLNRQNKINRAKHEIGKEELGRGYDMDLAGYGWKKETEDARHRFAMQTGENEYEEQKAEVQHQHGLKQEDISGKIAEERMVQQGQIDYQRRAQEAIGELDRMKEEQKRVVADVQHQAGLDDARFKETLTGILHRIDQSNLDWQQKLDEYNRMAAKLGFADSIEKQRKQAEADAAVRRVAAEADADVANEQLKTWVADHKAKVEDTLNVGKAKIELDKEQAELQEVIDRNAEDRAERQAAAQFDREERRSLRSFAQEMERKQRQVEMDIAKLKEENAEKQRIRDQELRIKELEGELELTRMKLEAQTKQLGITSDAETARINAENAAKEAEAKYRLEHEEKERAAAEERAKQDQAREDNLMNKADDLFRYVMQLEQAMDQARQTMQIHFDDNDTKVRVAQTEVDKARAEHGADEMLQGIKDLGRKLDENQQQEILRRLDDLIASLNGRGGKHSNPDEKVTDIAKDVDKIRKSIDEARKELEKIRTSVKTAAEQRRCIYCRNPLSKDARFCPACGKSQTGPVSSSGTAAKNKICSLCRTSNPADATTCKNCGKEL